MNRIADLLTHEFYSTVKILFFILLGFQGTCLAEEQDLDSKTGLIIDEGYKIVEAYCIGCHTGKRIREHRATRKSWIQTVQKMQQIGQWTLNPAIERQILDYLSKNYPLNPSDK